MLSDCPCEDVNFCKSRSCYVPEKCNSKNCKIHTSLSQVSLRWFVLYDKRLASNSQGMTLKILYKALSKMFETFHITFLLSLQDINITVRRPLKKQHERPPKGQLAMNAVFNKNHSNLKVDIGKGFSNSVVRLREGQWLMKVIVLGDENDEEEEEEVPVTTNTVGEVQEGGTE